jgi:hypothetical protein
VVKIFFMSIHKFGSSNLEQRGIYRITKPTAVQSGRFIQEIKRRRGGGRVSGLARFGPDPSSARGNGGFKRPTSGVGRSVSAAAERVRGRSLPFDQVAIDDGEFVSLLMARGTQAETLATGGDRGSPRGRRRKGGVVEADEECRGSVGAAPDLTCIMQNGEADERDVDSYRELAGSVVPPGRKERVHEKHQNQMSSRQQRRRERVACAQRHPWLNGDDAEQKLERQG